MLLYLVTIIGLSSCHQPKESVNQRELQNFDSLPHSPGDSLLFSEFFSIEKNTPSDELGQVKFQIQDTSILHTIIRNSLNDSVRIRAKLMLASITVQLIRDIPRGIKIYEDLLGQNIKTKQAAQILIIGIANLFFLQERHTEALALSYLGQSLCDVNYIVSINAQILIGSILLEKDAYSNSIRIFDTAISKLTHNNFKNRLKTCLVNKSLALYCLKDYSNALKCAKRALHIDPLSVHIKNKISKIYSKINTDSALAYVSYPSNCNSIDYQIEKSIITANLYTPLRPDIAHNIYLTAFKNSYNSLKDPILSLEILFGLRQTIDHKYSSQIKYYDRLIDSTINHSIRSFNIEIYQHYLEFFKEIMSHRIYNQLTQTNIDPKSLISCLETFQYFNSLQFLDQYALQSKFNKVLSDHNIYIDSITSETCLIYAKFGKELLTSLQLRSFTRHTSISNLNHQYSLKPKIEYDNKKALLYLYESGDTLYFVYNHKENIDIIPTHKANVNIFIQEFHKIVNSGPITYIILNDLSEHIFLSSNNTFYEQLTSYTTPIFTLSRHNIPNKNLKVQLKHIDVFAYTNINQIDITDFSDEIPGSYHEAKLVKSLVPKCKLFIGEEANTLNLSNSLSNSAIIHIATHGIYHNSNKYLTGIIFKNSRYPFQPKAETNIQTQIVTLLSCNATNGIQLPGLGKLSITKMLITNPGRIVLTTIEANLEDQKSLSHTYKIYDIFGRSEFFDSSFFKNIIEIDPCIRIFM